MHVKVSPGRWGTTWKTRSNYLFSGGSKGGHVPPPRGPNSFNFMQFLGKFGKIVCWRPPGELAPPPRGNPGSATAFNCCMQSPTLLSTFFNQTVTFR